MCSILAVTGALIAPPVAAFGGYTVAPAIDVPGQEYHDFDEISFFDLPPIRAMNREQGNVWESGSVVG